MTRIRFWSFLLIAALPTLGAQEIPAADQRLLERLVLAEAGGEGHLGMALVARSVLNRTALVQARKISPGTYLANGRSVNAMINARMQYEPVSSGSINRSRSSAQLARARRAIELARDTPALERALAAEGVTGRSADRLLRATGFRTRSAYRDASQQYDRQGFRNHVFNADRFSRRHDVRGVFERRFGHGRSQAAHSAQRSGEVGPGARGPRVQALQRQLNAAGAQLDPDGIYGPQTREALLAFQRARGLQPTGELDGATQRALSRQVAPASPFAAQLRQIMPRLSARLAGIYAPHLERAMAQAKINTPARKAAFLATLAYESRELSAFEEVGSGQCSADSTLGDAFAKHNYIQLAKGIGLDLLRAPSVAASPSTGFKVAAAHWQEQDANTAADAGDFREVTRVANWGREDYAQRLSYYVRARAVLGGR